LVIQASEFLDFFLVIGVIQGSHFIFLESKSKKEIGLIIRTIITLISQEALNLKLLDYDRVIEILRLETTLQRRG
jgi:hypothetical protein